MSDAREHRLQAIAVFQCDERYPYEAPRQGSLRRGDSFRGEGIVRLQPNAADAQALRELNGFERIWLVYGFHHNTDSRWKPIVSPPRADAPRVGVFASRSPYRPNGLGLSCVRLLEVDTARGELSVAEYDLLNGTPIYDIKPYIPYADSFPHARAGWIDALPPTRQHTLVCGPSALARLDWLRANGGPELLAFAQVQLSEDPDDAKRKRIKRIAADAASPPDDRLRELAYRTWRLLYRLPEQPATSSPAAQNHTATIEILDVYSGYSAHELDATDTPDPYGDLELHRAFRRRFTDEPG